MPLLFLTLAAEMFPLSCWGATLDVVVQGGKIPYVNAPVKINVAVPQTLAEAQVVRLKDEAGGELIGQLTGPSLLSQCQADPGFVLRELHFIAPRISPGAAVKVTGELLAGPANLPGFRWDDVSGKYADLRFDNRPVLRYMYEAPDDSTKERREETMKVYHHVFDPAGQRLLTKGPGGLFPHHRGVFYGFNKITYGQAQKADVWHCRNGESQTHEAFLSVEAGPVLGRHRVAIHWRGTDGKPFAREEREMTAYNTQGGTLLEFASRLTSMDGKVILDGDPQHAGFQFRATQLVPDSADKLTYYIRPDGPDKPGSFRNWPTNPQHVNLPWNALSFVVENQRYTVLYLDRPLNPKEARFSERDYGRFGSYFEAMIEGDQRLEVNYRLWVQEGELTVEQANVGSEEFVRPPQGSAVVKS
jgi:hypothetical protein